MEDELEVLRTKLVLLDTQIYKTVGGEANYKRPYAITWLNSHFFRFTPPHNCFYATEREAMDAALYLLLSGEAKDQLENR